MMPKIELRNIRFCYGEKSRCFRALDDLNLSVDDGEFVCLVGRSGCGKTTLLRLIAGLTKPEMGEVLIDGRAVTGPGTDRAVVFQNYTLFPWMTAEKNIAFAVKQSDKNLKPQEIKDIAGHFLEKVEMADSAKKYPCELSGGMKQRVAIAKALAMDSDILLMDEPFGALDTRIRSSLQDLVEELWLTSEKKKTVIFVTHDISEAVRLSSRIAYMEPGKIKEIIPVSIPRPRTGDDWQLRGEMLNLKNHLREMFYSSDEEEEMGCCCG